MMRLLRPIASEVMHCIGQIFDYYLFVVSLSLFFKEGAWITPSQIMTPPTFLSILGVQPLREGFRKFTKGMPELACGA